MLLRHVAQLLFFVCFLSSANLFAETRVVKFKSDINQLKADANKLFSLDMRTLLSAQGTGNLTWAAGAGKPAWLTIDSPKSLMFGTPTAADVGTKSFRLSVQDGESGAISQIEMKVVIAPVWKEDPLQLGFQNEEVPWTFDLKTKVTDSTSGPLTFQLETPGTLPSWMTLSSSGILSGTPKRANVGKYSGFAFVVSNPTGGSARAAAMGEVLKVIKGPKWLGNPLTIDDAFEDKNYQKNIVGLVMNYEGAPLSFRLVNGPLSGWARVAPDGVITGTPGKVDLGNNKLTVEVSSLIDGKTFTDVADLTLKVIHTNHSPEWKANPLLLPDAPATVPYSQSLAQSVSDSDGDALTFKKVSGPAWVSVSSSGVLSGTPDKTNLGENVVTVTVSDGEFSPAVTIKIKVYKLNEPPTWNTKPTVLTDAKEDFLYTQDLKNFSKDPDNDPLTFSLVSGPSWAKVSQQGILSGTPGARDLGLNKFLVKVADGVSGSDTAEIQINVLHTNHPPQWTQDPIRFTVPEESLASLNLAPFAVDTDLDKLTFSKVDGPTWGSISELGVLSGTPQIPDEGENNFRVRVADGQGGTAEVLVIVTVLPINHKPIWTQNPITLPDAPERVLYSQSLAAFAQDIDPNDTLTFSKVAGPSWATVSPQGILQGTPQRPDVGAHSVTVRVADKAGLSADVTVKVTVLKVNRPPQWSQNPILLPDAFEDKNFQHSVATLVSDADNDPVTFRKKSGPDWLQMSASGMLTGVPLKANVGNFSATFEVFDGEATAEVLAQGKVIHTNHAPVVNVTPSYQVKERATSSQDLLTVVTDSDNDPLAFSLIDTPEWITLEASGKLTLKPLFKNIGDHSVRYQVSDGAISVEGKFTVKVLRDPRPPVWLENPIRLRAAINKPFSADLNPKAKDLDGIAISFLKTSGPEWLSVAPSGAMNGVPNTGSLGENTFVVTVKNDLLGADVNVVIEVFDPNQAPFWKEDPVTLGNAPEKKPYSASLTNFAADPDSADTLTFSKISGPAWAVIAANGTLSGTPNRSDVGLNTFRARVTDGGGKFAEATILVTVDYVNQSPLWSSVSLPDAFEDKSYRSALAPFASDPDNDPVTFTKVNGPQWLNVAPNGELTGVPGKLDLGTVKVTFAVSDGKLSSQVTASLNVIHTNHPPVITSQTIAMSLKERESKIEDLAQYVTDSDGDALKFTLGESSSWVTLATDGKLSLKPTHSNLGEHSFTFQVTDGDLVTSGAFQVKVLRDPRPPVWVEDPIRFTTNMEKPFSASIKDKAKELDGVALTFSKVSGPAWLKLGDDGSLMGTPSKSDLGINTFTVSVKNDAIATPVTLIIEVINPNQSPIISTNPAFTVKEREVRNESLKSVVTDPDGDVLVFSLSSSVDWAELSTDGLVTLKPRFKNIGDHSFTYQVSDGQITAQGSFTVKVLRDPRPPIWTEDPLRFQTNVNVAFQKNIQDKAVDLDAIPLTFEKKSGPDWLRVTSSGGLEGTPTKADLGEQNFVVSAKNDLLSQDVQVIVTVVDPNRPPVWKQNPLVLLNAKEKQFYSQSVAQEASDPDAGDVLTFSKLEGPEWATVSASGNVTGIPNRSDAGLNVFKVRVTDKGGKFADASVQITVEIVNAAPQWKQNPIALGKIPMDEFYQLSLSEFASDSDNDKLTFTISDGPSWLTLSGDGQLSGTPRKKDLGSFTATVTVSDGYAKAQAGVFGKVFNVINTPPNIVPGSLFFVVKAHEVLEKKLNSPEIVSDPDEEKLAFEMSPMPAWVSLSTEGNLAAKPRAEEVGDHTFQLKVTDERGGTAEAPLYIRVLPNSQAPIWSENPIRFRAMVNKNFVDNISGKASDPQGLALSFSKQSGPQWLSLTSNGALNGVPKVGDLGENTFVVVASNGKQSAAVTVIVTVSDGQVTTDTVQIDEAVLGAPVENLWVVDHTVCVLGSNDLTSLLKKHLSTYFTALDKAGIHHSGVLISSHAKKWDGEPVKSSQGKVLFRWNDTSVVSDLASRIDSIASKSCYHSPIWSTFRFLGKLPEMADVPSSEFSEAGVPMETLMVSKFKDAYASFAAPTSQKDWNPSDYAKHFIELNQSRKKTFRVSAISPECLCRDEKCREEEAKCDRAGHHPYREIAKYTQGKHYLYAKPFSMASVLSDYAKEVVFRAYVQAKKRIRLSKKPLEPKNIEVALGGKRLPGNTGEQSDPWYFDPSSNEAVFQWQWVDPSWYRPGDKIEIRYLSLGDVRDRR